MSALPGLFAADVVQVGQWWRLPSGRIVVIRHIEDRGRLAQARVRYIDENGAMHVQDFSLRLSFITRGRLEHG